jgi:hypothetical protein
MIHARSDYVVPSVLGAWKTTDHTLALSSSSTSNQAQLPITTKVHVSYVCISLTQEMWLVHEIPRPCSAAFVTDGGKENKGKAIVSEDSGYIKVVICTFMRAVPSIHDAMVSSSSSTFQNQTQTVPTSHFAVSFTPTTTDTHQSKNTITFRFLLMTTQCVLKVS